MLAVLPLPGKLFAAAKAAFFLCAGFPPALQYATHLAMYTIQNPDAVGPLGRRGVALTSEIMHRHYVRDEAFVWDQITENVVWIGPLRAQFVCGLNKVKELLALERRVTFTMEQEEYSNWATAMPMKRICFSFRNIWQIWIAWSWPFSISTISS